MRTCVICGGALAANNRRGICQRSDTCRKANKRTRNRERNRAHGGKPRRACAVCGSLLRRREVCIVTEACREKILERIFGVTAVTDDVS